MLMFAFKQQKKLKTPSRLANGKGRECLQPPLRLNEIYTWGLLLEYLTDNGGFSTNSIAILLHLYLLSV